MKNGVVIFRMGVGMFFVLHANDDRHAYDNVMKETFNITRIKGHVCPYCFGMPPGKEWFQTVSKYDSDFLPVTNQKTRDCHTLKDSYKVSTDAVCISPVLEMVTL